MGTQTKVWTEAELMALPKDGHKYELVNGELQMAPAGVFGHGDIIAWLSACLTIHSRKNRLGTVFDGQSGFWMKSGNLRSPDISFISIDRLKTLHKKQHAFLNTAPDLAVEVLSPSETAATVHEKAVDYFQSGCRILWIVNTVEKTVQVYRSETSSELLKLGDSLDGEGIIPGSMPLADLFAEPDLE
jgi:Uma2 family endonuclease